ncbi:sialin-like isoform X2 [Mizuhopecten yessoensis]|uniref:Sialin n=1 Tax=Mizuhopecten yessoensis TaxID=6573 RepID=A0A210R354_MIZYE|nr:sialin-like isoform X2 [Mizuhopecten yessoensis]OWF55374.1 Sialin [Mizuhopecten yessoensis]
MVVAAKEKESPLKEEEEVPCCCSQRWILSYTGFLGFCCIYAVRVNFSVAIVCMVKTSDVLTNGTSLVNQSDVGTCVAEAANVKNDEHAEFDWDKSTRSTMLASFFYGYICTQVLGGWLSDRFGGRRVLGYTTLFAAICTLLTPVCARASVPLIYVLRVLLGLATGVSFPAMQSIWGRWAPPFERSKLVSVSYLGTMFGNIATFASSGVLCDYGFDNGWGSIFYITGGLTFLWVLMWFYVSADSPQEHRRISAVEREHIVSSIEYNTTKRTAKVPWKDLMKSRAMWACLTAHVCNNWTNYTLLTSLPAFMKAVLKFDIKQNGVLSAVPYLCSAFSGFLAGQTADVIRSRKILSTTATRRLYQVSAFVGAGVFSVATGFATCEHRDMAVIFLSIAVMFTGLCRAGYVVNHVDFAPKYAGTLYGITNTAATVPGMVAPIVAGALTPNDTQAEWRNVFYVCAAFDLFGALVFGMFGSGELEPWARDPDDDKQIDDVVMTSIDVEKAPNMDNFKMDDDNCVVEPEVNGVVNETSESSAPLEQKGDDDSMTESSTLKDSDDATGMSSNLMIDDADLSPERDDLSDEHLETKKDEIDTTNVISQEQKLTEIMFFGTRVSLEIIAEQTNEA